MTFVLTTMSQITGNCLISTQQSASIGPLALKTTQTKSDNETTLEAFMIRHQRHGKESFTHNNFTGIGAPYNMRFELRYDKNYNNEIYEFLEIYTKAFHARKRLHVIEMKRDVHPIIIDLDFAQDVNKRLYDPLILPFIEILTGYLSEYIESASNAVHTCYVLEKPKPRAHSKKEGVYKDGIHIIIPTINALSEIQLDIRKRFIEDHPNFFNNEHIINEHGMDDIYDKSVLEKNGWLMYGSCKPDDKMIWELTREYVINIETGTVVGNPNPRDKKDITLCSLFALRNKFSESKYTGKGIEIQNIKIMTPRVVDSIDDDNINHKRTVKRTMISALVSLLSVKRANNYDSWIKVGWCLQNQGFDLLDLWIEFSKKSPRKFTRGECDDIWAKMDAKKHKYRIGSLFKWAKQDSPDEFEQLVHAKAIDATRIYNEMKPTIDIGLCQKITYNENRAQPLPFDEFPIIMLQSKLGTGKTFQIAEAILKYKYHRILIISPRISYTLATKQRYQSLGIDVETYLDLRDRVDVEAAAFNKYAGIGCNSRFMEVRELDKIPKLIISPESMHRIPSSSRYDLVILDEIEANMQQFACKETQKDNQATNYLRLVQILSQCGKIIACDGSITSRTYEILQRVATKSNRAMVYIENQAVILKRKLHIFPSCTNRADKEGLVADKMNFIDHILDDLRAGKKIVIATSRQGFGEDIETTIKQELPHIKLKYYHGLMDDMEKRELADVNTHWAGLDCLIYSPVVTVGISFDHHHFDRMYVWASCKTMTARDMVQSMHRCRHLSENLVKIYIDNNFLREGIVEKSDWEYHMENKKQIYRDMYKEMKEASTDSHIREIQNILHDPNLSQIEQNETARHFIKMLLTCPEIETPEHIYINELFNSWTKDSHHFFYKEMLLNHLGEDGYTFHYMPQTAPTTKQRTIEKNTDGLYKNILDIDGDTFDQYMENQKAQIATAAEKRECNKYAFKNIIMAPLAGKLDDEEKLGMIYDYVKCNKVRLDQIQNVMTQLCSNLDTKDVVEGFAHTVLDFVSEKGPVVLNVTRICSLIGLDTCIDTNTIIYRKHIDARLSEISKLVRESLVLLNLYVDVEENKEKWLTYGFVSKKLGVLFNHWCGMKLKRVHRDGKGNLNSSCKLSWDDDKLWNIYSIFLKVLDS